MSKRILITGSTDGIGKLAAIQLAKENHEIILHGRNAEKLEKVVTEVKQVSGNENITGYVADFSDIDAVQNLGAKISEEIHSLDVLINNAGVFKSAYPTNSKGLDLRMVVNYMAPYAFTEKLLPSLKNSGAPRLINLSSAAQAPVSIDTLNGTENRPEGETYAQSKLALTMWSFDLAKNSPWLNVIAVNPGSLLNTNMVKEAYGHHWSSADKGASILHDLAVSETYADSSGKYFDNDKGEIRGDFGPAHADAYNPELIQNLLQATEDLVK